MLTEGKVKGERNCIPGSPHTEAVPGGLELRKETRFTQALAKDLALNSPHVYMYSEHQGNSDSFFKLLRYLQ